MENYYTNHLPFKLTNEPNKFFPSKQESQPSLMDKVMPLHQVIRFANQAASKKQSVYVTIEQATTNRKFNRTILKGRFRTSLNNNRQITFTSDNNKVMYLLKIDQILAIELAD